MSERLDAEDPRDRTPSVLAEKTAALRAARAGVWTYDPGHDRLRYCLGAAHTFGLPSGVRLAGLPLASLGEAVHPADRPLYRSRVASILKGGGAIDVTLRTDPAAGRSRRLLMRGEAGPGDRPDDVQISGLVVELDDDVRPTAGPGRGLTAPGIIDGLDHLLAARACLADLGASPGRDALPLIDVLLRHLGRILAQDLEPDSEADLRERR